jgi:hypothetical protein
LSDDIAAVAKEEIDKRIRSMFFLCIYCDNPSPLTLSLIEVKKDKGQSKPYVMAIFICPTCKNKILVKIQDQGKL